MGDNRTYIRVVFDKLLKGNIVFLFINKIVKFYCTICNHPIKMLKFDENLPLKKTGDISRCRFGLVNTKTSILD